MLITEINRILARFGKKHPKYNFRYNKGKDTIDVYHGNRLLTKVMISGNEFEDVELALKRELELC